MPSPRELPVNLAKGCFDVGLTAHSAEDVAVFWRDEIGACFDHTLVISDTHQQHRYDLNGSVLKINTPTSVPVTAPSGYREVYVARDDVDAPRLLIDPEGNRVILVPVGHQGIRQLGIKLRARDVAVHRRFFRQALGLPEETYGAFRVGDSAILLEQSPSASENSSLEGAGWRYLTIQVHDVRLEYERFLKAGGFPGMPIRQLRDVARFAMVRDPDGNWIELSQRASLTGPLGACPTQAQ